MGQRPIRSKWHIKPVHALKHGQVFGMYMKYIVVVFTIFFATVAQIMLKKASIFASNDIIFWKWFIIACLFFVIATFSNILVMKFFTISKSTSIISIGTIIFVCIGGIIFFNENVNIFQSIGIVLGCIAVYLIIR